MRRARAAFVVLFAQVLGLAHAADARAECSSVASPPALSQARSARWLVGDDIRFQSTLDAERTYLRNVDAALGRDVSPYQAFGAATVAAQFVPTIGVCSNRGLENSRLVRARYGGSAGLTHSATGLHLRLSFLHARDELAVTTSSTKGADAATTGYAQSLVALRVGHERYANALLGYVGSEDTFAGIGTGGVALRPKLVGSAAPGFFVGLSVPEIHSTVVTLLQRGRPELVSLLSRDLPMPFVPVMLSLGPTYIREEQQTVGLVRLRGSTLRGGHGPKRTFERLDSGAYQEGMSSEHS
ncbi:MAG: hypothetical protein U0169_20940, partial [Polyangiaceae bacterium]